MLWYLCLRFEELSSNFTSAIIHTFFFVLKIFIAGKWTNKAERVCQIDQLILKQEKKNLLSSLGVHLL